MVTRLMKEVDTLLIGELLTSEQISRLKILYDHLEIKCNYYKRTTVK